MSSKAASKTAVLRNHLRDSEHEEDSGKTKYILSTRFSHVKIV